MAASDSTKVTEDPNFKGGVMSPNSKQTFAEMRLNLPTAYTQKIVLDEATFELAFLKCAMCKSLYNLTNKSPRLLPCHHTFCLECILNFYKAENDYRVSIAPTITSTSYDHAVPIMCPKCSTTFLTTKDGISELSMDHRIVQLFDFIGTTEKHEAEYCRKHHTQCLNFFCENCKESVCRDCTVLDHKECVASQQILDLKNAKDKYVPIVEKGIETMETEAVSLKEKKADFETAMIKCEDGDQDVINDIKQSFEKLRKALDDREKELLANARAKTGGGKEDFEDKIKLITDKQREVAEILETLKSFKDFDNLTKLYANYVKIQQYETVHAMEKEPVETNKAKIKFVGRDEETVKHRIEKYGDLQTQDSSVNGTGSYTSGYSSSYSNYGNAYSGSRYTGSLYSGSTGSGSSYRYTPSSSRTTYKY